MDDFEDGHERVKADLADVATAAERAGRAIETSLLRAVKTGKLGFEELKGVALSALDAIAAQALKGGIQALFGGAGGGANDGGLVRRVGGGGRCGCDCGCFGQGGFGGLGAALAGLLGAPGRATGGPVSPGRAYMVGERGPELFVPTSSGRVETGAPGGVREVRVAISVNAPAGTAPGAMAQSSRQVARAVKAALE